MTEDPPHVQPCDCELCDAFRDALAAVRRARADVEARERLAGPPHRGVCTCDLCSAYQRAQRRRNSARPAGYESRKYARAVTPLNGEAYAPHARRKRILGRLWWAAVCALAGWLGYVLFMWAKLLGWVA
jgi:hypothetical protein